MRLRKSLISVHLSALLLLTACVEEGQSYQDKAKEEQVSTETSLLEQTTNIVIEDVVGSVVQEILPNGVDDQNLQTLDTTLDLAELIYPEYAFLIRNARPSINRILSQRANEPGNTEMVYYAAKYVKAKDGDTYTFIPLSIHDLEKNSTTNKWVEKGVALVTKNQATADEITVRTLLIDTPEMKNKRNANKPDKYAKEAKNYAHKLLKNAKSIVLAYDKGEKSDHYGRQLMYVYVDSELIGVKLLEAGYAKVAYVNEPNTTFLKEYQIAEKKAKLRNLGVWGK